MKRGLLLFALVASKAFATDQLYSIIDIDGNGTGYVGSGSSWQLSDNGTVACKFVAGLLVWNRQSGYNSHGSVPGMTFEELGGVNDAGVVCGTGNMSGSQWAFRSFKV